MRGLLLMTLFAVGAPVRENPAPKEPIPLLERLQGEWSVEAIESNGITVRHARNSKEGFIIDGLRCTYVQSEKDGGRKYPGKFSISSNENPVQIDLEVEHPGFAKVRILGIVEVQQDESRLSYSNIGRPLEFAAPKGSPNFVLYLKRVKR